MIGGVGEAAIAEFNRPREGVGGPGGVGHPGIGRGDVPAAHVQSIDLVVQGRTVEEGRSGNVSVGIGKIGHKAGGGAGVLDDPVLIIVTQGMHHRVSVDRINVTRGGSGTGCQGELGGGDREYRCAGGGVVFSLDKLRNPVRTVIVEGIDDTRTGGIGNR